MRRAHPGVSFERETQANVPDRAAAPTPRRSMQTLTPDGVERRALMGGVLAVSAASMIPAAFAAAAAEAASDSFLALSTILTGRSPLDAWQAARLYEALIADDQQFAIGAQALLVLINQRKIDPL